jgi:hypothetical protein
MESEGSLPCSQEPATDRYPNPVHATLSCFSKIHFNIVLSPTSRSTRWCLGFWLVTLKPDMHFSSPLCVLYVLSIHSTWLDHCSFIWRRAQIMELRINYPTIAIFNEHKYICKIWGYHGGDYEDYRLLGCSAVYLVWTDVLEKRISSIFWVEKSAREEPAWAGQSAVRQYVGIFVPSSVQSWTRGGPSPQKVRVVRLRATMWSTSYSLLL